MLAISRINRILLERYVFFLEIVEKVYVNTVGEVPRKRRDMSKYTVGGPVINLFLSTWRVVEVEEEEGGI